ncbi:MAG: hypothetical protein CBC83_00910 [Flavobacteriales bacterium TMED123]|nr:MAG: hypothetical protein CBC83_00910 [Flavobacteriales bacterium TMED123]|tara:strand:+ start:2802 stop:3989 length:1188 start_codon:yes stop_codon:yes gene_type:complete
MRILQICSKPPYPEKDGYALAVNHMSKAIIAKGHLVKVIAISTPKHHAKDVPQEYLAKTEFENLFIDTSVRLIPAFLNLFSSIPYNTKRFYSDEFTNRLKQIIDKNHFDIILFEGLFVCPYLDVIKENSNAKLVLRSHNVESDIWKGIANQERNLIKKLYLNLLQKRLLNYEKSIVSKMDAIVCISYNDASWMQTHTDKSISVIPFAINTLNQEVGIENKNTIFHIGSMDWQANIDGINWFLSEVFPLIKKKKEKVILHLAGSKMPNYFNNLSNENIIIDGEVENAKTFMKKHNLMIVPLLNGSGIRIKILEAMAMGKTIISTSIGASGIHYKDKKNILIADIGVQFANQIIWCLENPLESKKIGENAQLNIRVHYDSEKIAKQLDSVLNKLQAQ